MHGHFTTYGSLQIYIQVVTGTYYKFVIGKLCIYCTATKPALIIIQSGTCGPISRSGWGHRQGIHTNRVVEGLRKNKYQMRLALVKEEENIPCNLTSPISSPTQGSQQLWAQMSHKSKEGDDDLPIPGAFIGCCHKHKVEDMFEEEREVIMLNHSAMVELNILSLK